MSKSVIYRFFTILMLLTMVVCFGSCTIAKISGRGSIPYMLNNPPAKTEVISHFNESKMITFDYTSAFDVSEILAEQLTTSGADAAINLTITLKADFASFCINMITLGIANAKIFQVEGDLVKAPNGLGSLLENSEILAEAETIKELQLALKKLQKDQDVVNLPTIVRTETGFVAIN